MQRAKILFGVIIALVIASIGLRVFRQEELADNIQSLFVPALAFYYCSNRHCRKKSFFYFLLLFGFGDLLGIFYYNIYVSDAIDSAFYFTCNLLYIAAYSVLIYEVIRSLNIAQILSKFAVHIIILLVLDIYCIMLVSDVAIKSDELWNVYEHILEFVYNTVIMILLTVTLINYLNRDSKKAMNLLLGALCIVFSEVIQVAYFYVSEISILGIAYSVLLLLAFFFFYLQATMEPENEKLPQSDSLKEVKPEISSQ